MHWTASQFSKFVLFQVNINVHSVTARIVDIYDLLRPDFEVTKPRFSFYVVKNYYLFPPLAIAIFLINLDWRFERLRILNDSVGDLALFILLLLLLFLKLNIVILTFLIYLILKLLLSEVFQGHFILSSEHLLFISKS